MAHKSWARPWMVHSFAWLIVFPALFLWRILLGIKYAWTETAEEIREDIIALGWAKWSKKK